jgi:hypothetical protein
MICVHELQKVTVNCMSQVIDIQHISTEEELSSFLSCTLKPSMDLISSGWYWLEFRGLFWRLLVFIAWNMIVNWRTNIFTSSSFSTSSRIKDGCVHTCRWSPQYSLGFLFAVITSRLSYRNAVPVFEKFFALKVDKHADDLSHFFYLSSMRWFIKL